MINFCLRARELRRAGEEGKEGKETQQRGELTGELCVSFPSFAIQLRTVTGKFRERAEEKEKGGRKVLLRVS